MNEVVNASIKEFNEDMDDATIIKKRERDINNMPVEYLVVYIQGIEVEKIRIDEKYTITYVNDDDTLNYLFIDIGEFEEDGDYSFEW